MNIQMQNEVSEFLTIAESWAQSNNQLSALIAKMEHRGRFDGSNPITDEGLAIDTTAHFQIAPPNISIKADTINETIKMATEVMEFAAKNGLKKAVDILRK